MARLRVQFIHGLEGSPQGNKARILARHFQTRTPAMDTSDGNRNGATWTLWLAPQVCLALSACLFAVPWDRPESRGRSLSAGPTAAAVVFVITPVASADVTAAPDVTTPSASIARFSIWPLPIVATVVDVQFLRQLATSLIGGLYGP